jgi:transmembrane 9 superfamily protein 2/4
MMFSSKFLLLLATGVFLQNGLVQGFYLPGIKPHAFKADEMIPLKVNALTSIHTQVPRDYYRLPYCTPGDGVEMASENLGEFLTGNKIENSPYEIYMMQERFCQVLCQVKLDNPLTVRRTKMFVKMDYHNNWIIDNLPSARILDGMHAEKRHYAGGFPIGNTMKKESDHPKTKKELKKEEQKKFTATKKFFENEEVHIFNHVHIHIDYHKNDGEDGYRVVGFAVEPLSVKHRFANDWKWDGEDKDGYKKPLSTCNPKEHLSRKDILEPQVVAVGEDILYTYDVTFQESIIEWSTRWDVYLTEDHIIPAKVHWWSINNSILVVVLLSGMVGGILIRNLRKDIAGYNAVPLTDEEKEEEIEEKGWKLVHADVFRPPSMMPMMFCVVNGTGLQLSVTSLVAIGLSAMGFLNPARRGSLLTSGLVFYMLSGIFAGYLSSRLYKCFRGRQWQLCTLLTAIFFPGVCFVFFGSFNIILAFFRSSGAVPFLDVVILAAMWGCVSIPLVFLGAFFGYKRPAYEFPCKTATISRAIPPSGAWFMRPSVGMLLAGLVPFSAAFVELFFIMTSLWMDQYYYVFGFTLVVFIIVLVTACEITLLLVYYQLCAENHRWWWFSFMCAGSTGLYLFLYSMYWFSQLHASKMAITYMLYFGYMFLVSLGLMFITGCAGFLSSFWFMRKIFSTIKVD